MLALQELTILMRLNWQSGRWPSKVVDIWSHRETFEFKNTFMWIYFYRFIENVWYILWQVVRRCQIKKWPSLRKCFPRWDGAECFSNVNTLKIKGRVRGGDFKLSPKAWRHFKIFTISHPKMVITSKFNNHEFPTFFHRSFCRQRAQITYIICQFLGGHQTTHWSCFCFDMYPYIWVKFNWRLSWPTFY